jgi:hypothetical protein
MNRTNSQRFVAACHLIVASAVAFTLIAATPALSAEQIDVPRATGDAAADVAALQTAFNSVPTTGGTVFIPAGSYSINRRIFIHSNTSIKCSPRAALVTVFPWVDRGASIGDTLQILENINWDAKSYTDHDLTINGCTFNQTAVATKAILFRFARRVKVQNVTCIGGGDCTAFLASDETVVEGSRATAIRNACWDHWEHPRNLVVIAGECSSNLYGVLVTGTNTDSSIAGVAVNATIEGGTITLTGSSGAGIWVQGGRPVGSGSTRVRISSVGIDLGATANNCVKVSGAANDVVTDGIQCIGGSRAPLLVMADTGGMPTDVHFRNTLIYDTIVSTGAALIVVESDDSTVENTIARNVRGHTFAVHFGGARSQGVNNSIPWGTFGNYEFKGRILPRAPSASSNAR